jgi:hypothetical protein
MKRIEYKVEWISEGGSYALQYKLQKYGDEGWELITIKENYTYIFKREKIINNKKEGI